MKQKANNTLSYLTSLLELPASFFAAMAQDAKLRKRGTEGAKTEAECQEDQGGLKIGRFRINLGRLPELLLLFVIAGMVAQIAMVSLDMSRQMAVISGLGVAVQLQRMGNWLRDWVAYKNWCQSKLHLSAKVGVYQRWIFWKNGHYRYYRTINDLNQYDIRKHLQYDLKNNFGSMMVPWGFGGIWCHALCGWWLNIFPCSNHISMTVGVDWHTLLCQSKCWSRNQGNLLPLYFWTCSKLG